MSLSIIIVNHNGRMHLEHCLASLAAAPPAIPHDITVVDNASNDESVPAVRRRWPGVAVIAEPANRGFAAANNAGFRATRGDLVLLLNNDTLVPAGAVDALCGRLLARPEAAAAGPRLVDGQGRAELSFGRMISPVAELRQKVVMRLYERRFGPVVAWVERETLREQLVDWVSGACLLVWRRDAEAVGLLDERYFIYTEDVDFCAAIRARGKRVLFTPAAQLTHLRGRVRAAAPVALNRAYRRSHLAFYEKHYPTWAPVLRAYLRIKERCRNDAHQRETSVRIAIDARKLRDYGIGTYIRNLLRHLSRLDTTTEYVLLCRGEDCGISSQFGPNFRTVREEAPAYSLREQFSVPRDLRRERADLFHAPHYVLPPLTPCRSIVTIHDCIHLRFPQYLPSRAGYACARGALWAATHRADRILTVSEASKHDILEYFRIPEAKIDVIHNAIDERFNEPPDPDEVYAARERYQLNDPFVLYAGNIKPHKNLERLIEAFHLFHSRGFDHVKLLIIGDEISKYATLRRAVHRLKLHKHVRFFGFVPAHTLAVRMRLAAVFVFPSLYEGFGLPPLEAMASGAPVITSNVSSLPEVVGDAALLIDPYDPEAIADALRRVLSDDELRRQLVERGLARARHFSWERSTRRVREIYGEVLAR